MNERVATIKAWSLEQVGCPYIYGATGQACTTEYRRARIAQYPQYAGKITYNCQRLSGGATSCVGCKWAIDGVGRLAYDCAQLTRFAMENAGIALVSGANSQWEKTAFVVKGEIKDMPKDMLCLLYRDDGDRMGHTGEYLGDSTVVHAKGHDYGVVHEWLSQCKFTHFGIPAGLYSNDELRAAGIDPGLNLPTLRRGSWGENVKRVQSLLNAEIGAGLVVDGLYGEATEEAVKKYQKAHGLTADGIVGPKTWAALGDPDEEPEMSVPPGKGPEDKPGEPEDSPENPPDMVSVSRADLAVWAEVLEEMARDIREQLG